MGVPDPDPEAAADVVVGVVVEALGDVVVEIGVEDAEVVVEETGVVVEAGVELLPPMLPPPVVLLPGTHW